MNWTPDEAAERLRRAACLLCRLPASIAAEQFRAWPDLPYAFLDYVRQAPKFLLPPPPAKSAIEEMRAAVSWLMWLKPVDAEIIWRRACMQRWKGICYAVEL